MSRIRATNTEPERRVYSLLRRLGYRPQRNRSDLPGVPDLVLPRQRVAIFVHGCFWHRHAGCRFAYTPRSNLAFWQRKFEANVTRDRKVRRLIKGLGLRIIVVWECQLANPERLGARLRQRLRGTAAHFPPRSVR